MTIPIYDQVVLPKVVLPLKNTNESSTKYLGTRGITGMVYSDIILKSSTNSGVAALETFWRDECNYGLEPFIISLPIFGASSSVTLLVKFYDNLNDSKDKGVWTLKRKLVILGEVVYTIDDDGNFILSDEGQFILNDVGDYVALMSKINTNKEISYGNS